MKCDRCKREWSLERLNYTYTKELVCDDCIIDLDKKRSQKEQK